MCTSYAALFLSRRPARPFPLTAPLASSALQADKSIIRAIDLEFATVYYAAHDLAYAMAGTCIKGAAAKRTFVRAYIEELSGAPATDEEVDSLALDAELFALPMHIGPLCCLHGECKRAIKRRTTTASRLRFAF